MNPPVSWSRVAALCFLALAVLLALSNLAEGRLQTVDPDSQVLLHQLSNHSRGAYYQHPLLWALILPGEVLVSAGWQPMEALRAIFLLSTVVSVILYYVLWRILVGNRAVALAASALLALFPSTQHLLSVLEDNVLVYPCLIACLIVSVHPTYRRSLVAKASAIALFSISCLLAFWCMLWFPFVLALWLSDPRPRFDTRTAGKLFLVMGFWAATFGVLSTCNDVWLGRVPGTGLHDLRSLVVGHGEVMTATPEVLLRRQPEAQRDRERKDPRAMFYMGMAESWFGYFRISGNSFVSGARSATRLSKLFTWALAAALCLLAYAPWRQRGSFRRPFLSAAVAVFTFIQLIFIYQYRDVAVHERFDFIVFVLPFAFYPLRKSRMAVAILALLVAAYAVIGSAFFWSYPPAS